MSEKSDPVIASNLVNLLIREVFIVCVGGRGIYIRSL